MTDSNNSIIHLKEIDSTNQYGLDNFESMPDRAFIYADQQTSGRGRRGRKWLSPAGLNLYASLILKDFPFPIHHATWIVSLAALELLREADPELDFWLKWPNDIFCEFRKIAGCLCEIKNDSSNNILGLVIGTGINVNMPADFFENIDQPATSLLAETGKKYDLTIFAENFREKTISLINTALTLGTENFYRLWKQENHLISQQVEIDVDKYEIISGKVVDINPDAELIVEKPDGTIINLKSGDVSIKTTNYEKPDFILNGASH